jgi:hypothetical protein
MTMKQATQPAGVAVVPTVPTRERPDKQNVVGLKDDELAFPGDILVTLFNTTKAKGGRLSVKPAPAGRCPCGGYGWGVTAQPDGGRFKLRAPELCSCVMKVVLKVCGQDARVASWTPPPDDDRMIRWRAACDARVEHAAAALAVIKAERAGQAAAAEAEAARLEERATDPQVAVAQEEARAGLRAARDAVAAASGAVRQAEALLAEARGAQGRAEAALRHAGEAMDAATAAAGPGAEVIKQLRATATIILGPNGPGAEAETVAAADLARAQREVARAQQVSFALPVATP